MPEKTPKARASNPKKLITLRVTTETERQIEELAEWLAATKTEVMLLAVERLHREIADRHG